MFTILTIKIMALSTRHLLFGFAKRIIPTFLKRKLKDHLSHSKYQVPSYSQQGEDLIIDYLLNTMIGNRPRRYIDIGANHPFRISNTAYFYFKGGSGLLIEPDPYLAQLLRKGRPRDIVMQCGVSVSGNNGHADFYQFDSNTLNTFSKEEADRYVSLGHKLAAVISVELKSPNEILETAGQIDLMNLDVEGLDFLLLQRIDWSRYRPLCLCVETCTYETKSEPRKLAEIIDFMERAGYMVYADTFINTIFVDQQKWRAKYTT